MTPTTPGEEPTVKVVTSRSLTDEEVRKVALAPRTDVAKLPDGQLLLIIGISNMTRAELAKLMEEEAGSGALILTSDINPEQVREIEEQIQANHLKWQQRVAEYTAQQPEQAKIEGQLAANFGTPPLEIN
ncbi:MAG: hypothetical protein AAB606_03605 [Patescibacteria group bacterium]